MSKTHSIFFVMILLTVKYMQGQDAIILEKPDLERGVNIMKALSLRASASGFDTTALTIRDLSDLLWAANGINRPGSGKRTAPSAMNAQDIDVYVIMKEGAFKYEPKDHALFPVATGDHRELVSGQQKNFSPAPVFCVLVSDISRFSRGEESVKLTWAAEDAGIVSQNISLFCASVGLATRVRASMDQEKLRDILNLSDSQHLMLNHPVGVGKVVD